VATQYNLMIDPVNPQNMYFCSIYNAISEVGGGKGQELTKGGYGFYRSFDGGYTWELSNTGFHEGFSLNRFAMSPENPEVFYAAANDNKGGLYKSTNKGSGWSKMDLPSEIKAVNNVFIDRNTKKMYIATGRKGGTYEEGGAWCSDNNGKSWKQIFKAPFVWQVETSPVNSDLIVVNAAGQGPTKASEFLNPGIYLSQNNGKSWDKINKGLGQPDKMVDVKPDPYNKDVLWCAGWGSGWFIAYLNGTKEGWLKK
ncbi:WD40/YVTN/BNR-like repeat-containing protein, partial [Flavobacterium sp.]|uniref:WD40/YVTN/BNR-like repeat-containing protein n=1 Tax=Flavobacterium sp. TaxID=239 RepID=UPI003C480952